LCPPCAIPDATLHPQLIIPVILELLTEPIPQSLRRQEVDATLFYHYCENPRLLRSGFPTQLTLAHGLKPVLLTTGAHHLALGARVGRRAVVAPSPGATMLATGASRKTCETLSHLEKRGKRRVVMMRLVLLVKLRRKTLATRSRPRSRSC